jgi:Putative transposase
MKAKYPSRGDRQETRQTRLLMSEQLGDSISWPFLTVLVFWICALFLGFALFARFIEHIAWQLMRIARGEIKRLIINVPPRSMKSAMVSVAFPGSWATIRPSASLRAHDCTGRRTVRGRHEVDCLSTELLLGRPRAVTTVPTLGLAAGRLQFCGGHAALADINAFAAFLVLLRRSEWVVYSKKPFGGPEAVLAYLARYTHRHLQSPPNRS